MKKVLALFSGGLDSLLSIFIMKRLGFEVQPIFFETPFFSSKKAQRLADLNGFQLTVINITPSHLEMLVNPRYGYGKNFNPCIDCHGLMFRTLKQYLEEFHADFVVSGEVLNQRPMSQRYDAMNAVKKLSTIGDLIIRPLCQKHLPDTLPIREGWVNKDDLYGFNGRSRSPQLALAAEFGLQGVGNSGGGCLLTDKGYTKRLKEIIDHNQLDEYNINFLKVGRHFRLTDTLKLVLNRTIFELEYLQTIVTNEIVIKCPDVPGPLGVLNTFEPVSEEVIKIAVGIMLRYCPKATENQIVGYGRQFNIDQTITGTRFTDAQIDPYRIN